MTHFITAVGLAWLRGALLIVIIVIGDGVARKLGFGREVWLLYLVWGLFMAAVFLSTYFAPKHKLIVGMSHTLTISALFAGSNWLQSVLGMPANFSKEQGFFIIVALIYVSSFIPALIAALIGMVASSVKK